MTTSDPLVRLRGVRDDDLEMIRLWRNQPRVRSMLFNSSEISAETHRSWWSRLPQEERNMFCVIETQEGRSVGTISIYDVERNKGIAQIGRMMIGPDDALRKHYMQGAISIMKIRARVELELRALYLRVKPGNLPAIHLYRACGFVEDSKLETSKYLVLRTSLELQATA